MPATLKSLVRSGRLAGGTLLVECVTPGIGHILAAAGAEFAFLDMEHSGFEAETVKAGLRFLEAGGVPAFVRVTSRDMHDISRIADIGAEGIIVSLVDNGTVAKAAVDALKYPPLGRRGVGLSLSHDNFRAPPTPAAALQAANDRTVLALMIETAEGVENADAIASTPGVDLIWVGHFDLSTSLGVAGQFDHPRFRDATTRIVAAAKRAGIGLGRLVNSVPEAEQAWRDGFRILAWSGDAWLIRDGLAAGLGGLRAMAERLPPSNG